MNTIPQSATITGWRVRFYDTLMKVFGVRTVYEHALSLLSPRVGERILDIGCGTGAFLKFVKAHTQGPLTLVGVDASEDMIQKAKESTRAESVQFQYADAAYLPFPDASFDAVLSILSLHHMPSAVRVRAIMETARVLRKGGRFVVFDVARPTDWRGRAVSFFLNFHSYTRGNWSHLTAELPRWGFAIKKEGTIRSAVGYLVADLT